jgi:hypothetical protein
MTSVRWDRRHHRLQSPYFLLWLLNKLSGKRYRKTRPLRIVDFNMYTANSFEMSLHKQRILLHGRLRDDVDRRGGEDSSNIAHSPNIAL